MTQRNIIPENAKIVFEAERGLFRVFAWEQPQFDGTTLTFQRIELAPVIKILVPVDGKILVLQEEQPALGTFLSLPGGYATWDEPLFDAAKRELLEETGYTGDLVSWKEMELWANYHQKRQYFVAQNARRSGERKLDAGEKLQEKLLTFDEFLALSDDLELRDEHLRMELFRARIHPEEKENLTNLLGL